MQKFNEWLENNGNYTITGPMGNSPIMRKHFESHTSKIETITQFMNDVKNGGKYELIRSIIGEESIQRVKKHLNSSIDMTQSFQSAQHAPQS